MKGLGLNSTVIDAFDKSLALKRIQRDIQNDFIFAPHLNIIFHKVGDELFDQLTAKLKSGQYSPRLPITIDVIKPNGFNRLGSILEPFDRLAYQLIVDLISEVAENEIDRNQVFSNKLLASDSDGFMFENSSESYLLFKQHIGQLCVSGKYSYALKADITSYFDRLYQHVLGNLLYSSGVNKDAVSFLEKFLLVLTQNDSHGIIQGVFPSEFLGNFALCDIDAQHSFAGLEYGRYVDDIYIFFTELNDAKIHKIRLANWLMKDGLTLNEGKTKIYQVKDLHNEETELDRLFQDAKEEVVEGTANIGYETNVFWNLDLDIEMNAVNIEIEATIKLFNAESKGEIRNKILRFCLPAFAKAENDYAMDDIISNYPNEPSMCQVYFGYLTKMIRKYPFITREIEDILINPNLLFDIQRKWLYSTLLYAESLTDLTIRYALADLQNQSKNNGLRSICAILLGKYGSATIRQILKTHYSNENSEFVKAAILFAAQYFPVQQKDTCFKAWSGHSEINSLIIAAIKKK
jgi:hypothetical protein